jgi:hypothetical protein
MCDKGSAVDALLAQEVGHFLEGIYGRFFSMFLSHCIEVVYLYLDKEQSFGWILVLSDMAQIRGQLVHVVESGYGISRDSAFLVEHEYAKRDDDECGRGNRHLVVFGLQDEGQQRECHYKADKV